MAKLFDGNGIAMDREFLVTYQITCKFRAKDEQMAERMLDRAISLGVSMAPMIVGIGCQAIPATAEALAALGVDPNQAQKA